MSNYDFFHLYKILIYFKIAIIGIYINIIYKTILDKIKFLNIINITLTKMN